MRASESPSPSAAARAASGGFRAMGARRMLVFGGIALIVAGMMLGEIFAVFVLHPNAGRIGESLLAATRSVFLGDATAAGAAFGRVGGFLENRGTKVDTHAHMIAFGYFALILALLEPYILLSERTKKIFAAMLLFGAALLPVGVFLIHYVGLAYSPFTAIGWASVAADFGGLLVLIAVVTMLAGLARHLRQRQKNLAPDELLRDRSWAARALLAGGTVLVLLGFIHGAYYAGADLYAHEKMDRSFLAVMTAEAAAGHEPEAEQAVQSYGALQANKAVKIAAHAHIIEFGLLAMLLSFFQPYVFLSERWKRTWVKMLLLGSLLLPVFVLLELRLGLVAGGLADIGGLLVVIALLGMMAGVFRYTGKLDAAGAPR
ncbi:MAG: hypothetical protein ACRD50_05555 [Candidatus Acidiferrales bacterium]